MQRKHLTYPAPQTNVLPIELDGVARALANEDGFWKSCSGCHELDEGVPTGPYSSVMKCHLGMGCSECGGIGAIWDTTDYEEMGRLMASDALPSPQTHLSGLWLPINQADKTITDVQDFPEVSMTIRTSDRYWVRDDDGRVYEAAWSEGNNGRDYWWDFEGESPVDPVEFMPHPLDPRYALATEGKL